MRLLSLQVHNFRSFGACQLDLNVDGLIGVKGENGAGKSTLFSAVEWALFGTVRGRGGLPARRYGSSPEEPCQVALEFMLADQHFVVTRRDGATSATTLRIASETEPLARGQKATTEAVRTVLGLAREDFISTFYARQREIQSLDPRAKPEVRRGHLERLLGIERIRRAVDLARADMKQQDILIKALEPDSLSIDEARRLVREREEQAKKHAPEVIKMKDRVAEARAERKKARQAQSRLHRQAQLAADAQLRLKEAENAAALTEERAQAAEKSAIEAKEASERMKLLYPSAARVEKLTAEERVLEMSCRQNERRLALRERLIEARQQAVALQDELKAATDPSEDLGRVETRLEEIEAALDALSARRTELQDQLREKITKIEKCASRAANAARGAELDDLLSSLPKKMKELEGTQKLIGEAESDHRALVRTIDAETSHGLEIKSHGRDASCPRCKRVYGEDFEKILAEYSRELSKLELKRSELEKALQEQRLIEMRVAPQIAKLRELQAERVGLGETGDQRELKTELNKARVHQAQLERQINEATRQLEALGKEQRSKRTRRQTLVKQASHRDAITLKKREVEDQVDFFAEELKQLGESDYDKDVHAQLREQLQEALDAAKELAEIKRVGEGRELAERRAHQAREKAQEALNQKLAEASAASGVQIDPKALQAAERRAELAEKECDNAEDSLRKAERAAVLESEAVKAAHAELARARQQARRIAKERQELRYRVAVTQGLEAYRAESTRRAVPQLEAETAHLLSQVTGGRYTDVNLTEEYALEIVDNGVAHPLKRFSGGEQDLASLCLRLAISKALARQRGADASFVILDEVFGSQDLVRRQSLIDQLRELNREFRQVFIVSHFDDVAELCDCEISVSLEDGVSQAAIRA